MSDDEARQFDEDLSYIARNLPFASAPKFLKGKTPAEVHRIAEIARAEHELKIVENDIGNQEVWAKEHATRGGLANSAVETLSKINATYTAKLEEDGTASCSLHVENGAPYPLYGVTTDAEFNDGVQLGAGQEPIQPGEAGTIEDCPFSVKREIDSGAISLESGPATGALSVTGAWNEPNNMVRPMSDEERQNFSVNDPAKKLAEATAKRDELKAKLAGLRDK